MLGFLIYAFILAMLLGAVHVIKTSVASRWPQIRAIFKNRFDKP